MVDDHRDDVNPVTGASLDSLFGAFMLAFRCSVELLLMPMPPPDRATGIGEWSVETGGGVFKGVRREGY